MKTILLDRDGVINQDSPEYIKSPSEWIPIPGSLKAIAQLKKAHYKVMLITNQSGIARGYYDFTTLDKIHEKMQTALKKEGGYIDHIFICPHLPTAHCSCRKPKPTLLLQAMAQYGAIPEKTPYVGDQWRDIQAAQAAGCKPILVKTGQGLSTIANQGVALETIPTYDDLAHYVEELLTSE